MNVTAAAIVKAELDTALHHIAFYTLDAAKLEADLAEVQDKLNIYKARAVQLEDALKEGAAA